MKPLLGDALEAHAPPRAAEQHQRHRILMLLENNPYPQDVRVRNEAEALASAGHEVMVLAPLGDGQRRRAKITGVEVWRYWLPVSDGGILGFVREYAVAHVQLFIRAIWQLLRGADVVHLHNPPDTLFPVGMLARLMGRKVVFDHHDLFPELMSDKFGSSSLTALARAAQWASLKTATTVLVTNSSQAGLARDRARLPRSKLTTVRNGPKGASLAPSGCPRGGRLSDPHLMFLGELDVQDGVLSLPELLGAPGLEHARLTVVGDGAARAELARRLRQAGLSDRVSFTGRVDHSRIPELLATADVCIDPAPCSELNHRSTMIKVAEYLAAARPVVAFELVETRNTAEDAALYARCGEIASFAAHVRRLAEDADLRERMSRRAAERAQELTWERSETALRQAYRSLT